MLQIKWAFLAVIMMLVIQVVWAGTTGKGENTIIIGGEHGCGPKAVLKIGGKKKGDLILLNDCKEKHKEQQYHFIPYPMYHNYGY